MGQKVSVVRTTSSRTDKAHISHQKMRCRYWRVDLMQEAILVRPASSSWKLLQLLLLLMPAIIFLVYLFTVYYNVVNE
jgi:hypothetical protein